MRDVATANQQPSETSLDLQLLLGPPLLEGEDPAAYEALRRQIQSAVAPADVFDEIWVRDIADRLWETFRLRRLKVKLMQSARHEGLRRANGKPEKAVTFMSSGLVT